MKAYEGFNFGELRRNFRSVISDSSSFPVVRISSLEIDSEFGFGEFMN